MLEEFNWRKRPSHKEIEKETNSVNMSKLVTLLWSKITLFMSGDVIIPNKEGWCGGNQSKTN